MLGEGVLDAPTTAMPSMPIVGDGVLLSSWKRAALRRACVYSGSSVARDRSSMLLLAESTVGVGGTDTTAAGLLPPGEVGVRSVGVGNSRPRPSRRVLSS